MAITLGSEPEDLTVHLVTGADFKATLILKPAWPVGTTLTLVSGATTWTATISGTDATFDVDKAAADLLADGASIKLKYVNGTTDQTLGIGTVKRHD